MPDTMRDSWYFFLFFVVSIAFAAGLLGAIALVRYRRRPLGDKGEPYECGVEPATPTARGATSIRFYLLTLVFIVFEVETFLLFPWAVVHPTAPPSCWPRPTLSSPGPRRTPSGPSARAWPAAPSR